jgi:hypothetical protein
MISRENVVAEVENVAYNWQSCDTCTYNNYRNVGNCIEGEQ